jgi:hypothetical protein
MDAHSDTVTFDNKDVFGYLPNGDIIYCQYDVDDDGTVWATVKVD